MNPLKYSIIERLRFFFFGAILFAIIFVYRLFNNEPLVKNDNPSIKVVYQKEPITVVHKKNLKTNYAYFDSPIENDVLEPSGAAVTTWRDVKILCFVFTSPDLLEIRELFPFTHFSKAFDKVPHDILLKKLNSIGVGGKLLSLLSSYLSNRYQCVRVNEVFSSWILVTSGVPQGSLLGPILFIIFINDLPTSCISSLIYLFANDSKALNTCLLSLQNDLENCIKWAVENEMVFNANKTQFIVFGGSRDNQSITMAEKRLSPIECVKDLGISISENLKWSYHISQKMKLCYGLLTNLRRNIPYTVPSSTKCNLIKSYVLSSLLYGSEVWHPSSEDLKKMELLLKRCMKWVTSGTSYKDRLVKCQMMPIACILQFKDLIMLNKLVTSSYDFPIWDYIQLKLHSIPLRCSTKPMFVIRKTVKKISDQNFFARAVKYSNKLHHETDLNILEDNLTFKQKLRTLFKNFVEINYDDIYCKSYF